MLKVNTPIVRESMVMDPDTGKPIVVRLDPPGLMLGFRTKQSKQTYMINILDVYMAAKHAKGEDFRLRSAPAKQAPKAEPSPRELIKEVLTEKHKLHFSQVRQQLKNRGLEVSKRIMGDLMSMMHESGQVEQDGMYYSLKKSA